MFETLKQLPVDAILGIMALYREDQDSSKIDLSVGVYQDENGNTPIFESVRRGEQQVLAAQQTKSYVSIAGNAGFNAALERLLFGDEHPALRDGRVSTVQTPGGSGGLCVAAHLLLRAQSDARIWLSDPSWPNHMPLLQLAGLKLEQYFYYDYQNHCIGFDRMLAEFEKLDRGKIVLLHGCCHNPSGADLSREQWLELTELFERRGIVPFIDFAYLGMGQGIDEDAFGVRLMAERLPEVVIVTSCSKNFGLYRERVGAVSIVSKDAQAATLALNNASNIARGIYSMPPDHGAAIVAEILCDDELRPLWIAELSEMRDRLNDLRCLLANKLQERNAPYDFSFIAQEHGMFSFLGISKEQVIRLREEFHIYLVESSRINVAGVNQANVDTIADAIVAVL
ncbi:MAG: aromatic amino acid transaminase [Candidatus Rariloculaceae bacterium]